MSSQNIPTETVTLKNLKEWNLVWISTYSGLGVAERLTALIEKELGIKVVLHDLTLGGLKAVSVLDGLLGKSENYLLNQLPTFIPKADFIVFEANPYYKEEAHPVKACVDGSTSPSGNCLPETYITYRTTLDAIYKEIFRLRAGKLTIIRAYHLYFSETWLKDGGIANACVLCAGYAFTAFSEVAESNHVPVIHLTDLFNGPNHDQDPALNGMGSFGPPNEKRQEAIAEAIWKLGYDPVITK